jgi:hypothetical protein
MLLFAMLICVYFIMDIHKYTAFRQFESGHRHQNNSTATGSAVILDFGGFAASLRNDSASSDGKPPYGKSHFARY